MSSADIRHTFTSISRVKLEKCFDTCLVNIQKKTLCDVILGTRQHKTTQPKPQHLAFSLPVSSQAFYFILLLSPSPLSTFILSFTRIKILATGQIVHQVDLKILITISIFRMIWPLKRTTSKNFPFLSTSFLFLTPHSV